MAPLSLISRTRAYVVVLGTLILVTALAGIATGHSGCSTATDGTWTVHTGDEHANDCSGGTGKDSMFGYGANDLLKGGSGNDILRGAQGDDDLRDEAGGGDVDKVCDGGGWDSVDLSDGDDNDIVYWVSGDGQDDHAVLDFGDDEQVVASCPV